VKIDSALAAGEVIRGISRDFAVSEDALSRHKAHVAGAIVKATEEREVSIGDSIMSKLETLHRRAERVLSEAEASGDGRLALAGIREIRETLGALWTVVGKGEAALGGKNGNLCPRCAELYGLTDQELDGRLMELTKKLLESPPGEGFNNHPKTSAVLTQWKSDGK
jgi:hypothetical protein